MNNETQLAEICARLGASPEQARVMASQLLKRAGQLAEQRGTTPEGELKRLLELLTTGRGGEVPKDFSPPPPLPPRTGD